jgi:hypothetical protein
MPKPRRRDTAADRKHTVSRSWQHSPCPLLSQQMMIARNRIAPQQVENDCDEYVNAVIEQGRGSLIGKSDVGREDGGGKGNDGDSQKQEQVQNHQRVIASLYMHKQPVMVDPHHANECKADQEREIGWPLPKKLIAKSTVGGLGNLDLKDKQRDGNSEDSVRKSLYPAGLAVQRATPHGMLWACKGQVKPAFPALLRPRLPDLFDCFGKCTTLVAPG